ncbi:Conserved_hypothetical protein [Hexamita inflata]|uniref:Uncharacterized protein n=1 Tax=Hexamita inflata TaxID=28002 RepID=A0AA86NPR5_9EUKA|nr:Conserved hypothetical protein [Hexamita inflata]
MESRHTHYHTMTYVPGKGPKNLLNADFFEQEYTKNKRKQMISPLREPKLKGIQPVDMASIKEYIFHETLKKQYLSKIVWIQRRYRYLTKLNRLSKITEATDSRNKKIISHVTKLWCMLLIAKKYNQSHQIKVALISFKQHLMYKRRLNLLNKRTQIQYLAYVFKKYQSLFKYRFSMQQRADDYFKIISKSKIENIFNMMLVKQQFQQNMRLYIKQYYAIDDCIVDLTPVFNITLPILKTAAAFLTRMKTRLTKVNHLNISIKIESLLRPSFQIWLENVKEHQKQIKDNKQFYIKSIKYYFEKWRDQSRGRYVTQAFYFRKWFKYAYKNKRIEKKEFQADRLNQKHLLSKYFENLQINRRTNIVVRTIQHSLIKTPWIEFFIRTLFLIQEGVTDYHEGKMSHFYYEDKDDDRITIKNVTADIPNKHNAFCLKFKFIQRLKGLRYQRKAFLRLQLYSYYFQQHQKMKYCFKQWKVFSKYSKTLTDQEKYTDQMKKFDSYDSSILEDMRIEYQKQENLKLVNELAHIGNSLRASRKICIKLDSFSQKYINIIQNLNIKKLIQMAQNQKYLISPLYFAFAYEYPDEISSYPQKIENKLKQISLLLQQCNAQEIVKMIQGINLQYSGQLFIQTQQYERAKISLQFKNIVQPQRKLISINNLCVPFAQQLIQNQKFEFFNLDEHIYTMLNNAILKLHNQKEFYVKEPTKISNSRQLSSSEKNSISSSLKRISITLSQLQLKTVEQLYENVKSKKTDSIIKEIDDTIGTIVTYSLNQEDQLDYLYKSNTIYLQFKPTITEFMISDLKITSNFPDILVIPEKIVEKTEESHLMRQESIQYLMSRRTTLINKQQNLQQSRVALESIPSQQVLDSVVSNQQSNLQQNSQLQNTSQSNNNQITSNKQSIIQQIASNNHSSNQITSNQYSNNQINQIQQFRALQNMKKELSIQQIYVDNKDENKLKLDLDIQQQDSFSEVILVKESAKKTKTKQPTQKIQTKGNKQVEVVKMKKVSNQSSVNQSVSKSESQAFINSTQSQFINNQSTTSTTIKQNSSKTNQSALSFNLDSSVNKSQALNNVLSVNKKGTKTKLINQSTINEEPQTLIVNSKKKKQTVSKQIITETVEDSDVNELSDLNFLKEKNKKKPQKKTIKTLQGTVNEKQKHNIIENESITIKQNNSKVNDNLQNKIKQEQNTQMLKQQIENQEKLKDILQKSKQKQRTTNQQQTEIDKNAMILKQQSSYQADIWDMEILPKQTKPKDVFKVGKLSNPNEIPIKILDQQLPEKPISPKKPISQPRSQKVFKDQKQVESYKIESSSIQIEEFSRDTQESQKSKKKLKKISFSLSTLEKLDPQTDKNQIRASQKTKNSLQDNQNKQIETLQDSSNVLQDLVQQVVDDTTFTARTDIIDVLDNIMVNNLDSKVDLVLNNGTSTDSKVQHREEIEEVNREIIEQTQMELPSVSDLNNQSVQVNNVRPITRQNQFSNYLQHEQCQNIVFESESNFLQFNTFKQEYITNTIIIEQNIQEIYRIPTDTQEQIPEIQELWNQPSLPDVEYIPPSYDVNKFIRAFVDKVADTNDLSLTFCQYLSKLREFTEFFMQFLTDPQFALEQLSSQTIMSCHCLSVLMELNQQRHKAQIPALVERKAQDLFKDKLVTIQPEFQKLICKPEQKLDYFGFFVKKLTILLMYQHVYEYQKPLYKQLFEYLQDNLGQVRQFHKQHLSELMKKRLLLEADSKAARENVKMLMSSPKYDDTFMDVEKDIRNARTPIMNRIKTDSSERRTNSQVSELRNITPEKIIDPVKEDVKINELNNASNVRMVEVAQHVQVGQTHRRYFRYINTIKKKFKEPEQPIELPKLTLIQSDLQQIVEIPKQLTKVFRAARIRKINSQMQWKRSLSPDQKLLKVVGTSSFEQNNDSFATAIAKAAQKPQKRIFNSVNEQRRAHRPFIEHIETFEPTVISLSFNGQENNSQAEIYKQFEKTQKERRIFNKSSVRTMKIQINTYINEEEIERFGSPNVFSRCRVDYTAFRGRLNKQKRVYVVYDQKDQDEEKQIEQAGNVNTINLNSILRGYLTDYRSNRMRVPTVLKQIE